MKVKQSGFNEMMPRLMIAPGEGDFAPFDGYIEIVFTGYNDDGMYEVFGQAAVRINVSFSGMMTANETAGWAEALTLAADLAANKVNSAMPENVLNEWRTIKRNLAQQETAVAAGGK